MILHLVIKGWPVAYDADFNVVVLILPDGNIVERQVGNVLQNLAKHRAAPLPVEDGKSAVYYKKAIKVLGYELSQGLDPTLSPYFTGIDARDGYANLYKLNGLINRHCEQRLVGLHRRFQEPTPVTRKATLSLSLSLCSLLLFLGLAVHNSITILLCSSGPSDRVSKAVRSGPVF